MLDAIASAMSAENCRVYLRAWKDMMPSWNASCRVKEASSSFLQKRTKKLFLLAARSMGIRECFVSGTAGCQAENDFS
jgi:hypothetical protein